MYNNSVEHFPVVTFSQKAEKIGEMMRLIYRSFLHFASRLCSLETRISSYQDHKGYNWVDGPAQKNIKSDFYGYVRINQKHMEVELGELETKLQTCKKEVESFIYQLSDYNYCAYDHSVLLKPDQNGIIRFPKASDKDKEVVQTLSILLNKNETLAKELVERHRSVTGKAASLFSQMRGQFSK